MVAVESGTQSGTNSQRLAYLPQRQLSRSSRWQATSVCASAPSSGSSSFRRQQRPQPSQSDSHSAAVISARDLVCQKGGFLRVGSLMGRRSEEHTSELQSLMRISYAVFCLKKKKKQKQARSQKCSEHMNDE